MGNFQMIGLNHNTQNEKCHSIWEGSKLFLDKVKSKIDVKKTTPFAKNWSPRINQGSSLIMIQVFVLIEFLRFVKAQVGVLPSSTAAQTQASAWSWGGYIISLIKTATHPPSQPPCKVLNWHDRSKIELYIQNKSY